MDKDGNGQRGINGVEVLQILFIGLKLTKVISWSWFWVLAPTWISIIIALIVGVVLILLNK